MKITSPDTIKMNEQEFIDSINAELDWERIEKLVLEKHQFHLQDEVDYKKGDIVVYDNQVAYQFDFDLKVALSVIMNKNGECVAIKTSGERGEKSVDQTFSPGQREERNCVIRSGIGSELAEMISDINRNDG